MWNWGASATPQSNVLAWWCGSLLFLIFIQPTVIIYPLDYLPVANHKQQEMLDTIVHDVAKYCQIPIKAISFKDLWLKFPPEDAAGKPLEVYLQDVSIRSMQTSMPKSLHRPDEIHSFTTFITTSMNSALLISMNTTEHLSRPKLLVGDGSPPAHKFFRFFDSSFHFRDVGRRITRAQRDDAMQRINVYKDWVLQKVLHIDDETALVVLPITDAEPNYRDTDPRYGVSLIF